MNKQDYVLACAKELSLDLEPSTKWQDAYDDALHHLENPPSDQTCSEMARTETITNKAKYDQAMALLSEHEELLEELVDWNSPHEPLKAYVLSTLRQKIAAAKELEPPQPITAQAYLSHYVRKWTHTAAMAEKKLQHFEQRREATSGLMDKILESL